MNGCFERYTREKEKKEEENNVLLGLFCHLINENIISEMSPKKSTSLIMNTGDIGKFPPVTPPSLQNENKEGCS